MKKEEKAFLHKRKWFVTSLEASRGVYVNHRDFVDKIRSIEKQLDPDFCKNNLIRKEHRTTKNTIYWLTKKGCKKIAEKLSAEKRFAFEQRYKDLFDVPPADSAPETVPTNPKLDPPKPQTKSIEPYVPQTVEDLGVFEKDGKIVVSSRTVAKIFEKDHKNVLRDISERHCSPFFRRLNFEQSFYSNEQGKPQPEVLMTRDGCMFLIMSYNGETADAIKESYINVFNAMEAKLRASSNVPSIVPDFTDPDSSRRGWIVAVEKGLEFARALDVSEKKVALLTEQVKEAAPAVEFKKNLEAAPGSMDMTDFAALVSKKLGRPIGRNTIEKYFRETKVFIGGGVNDPERNRPSMRARSCGYFEDTPATEIQIGKKGVKHYFQPMITGKGIIRYLDNGILRQESEKNQLLLLADDAHNKDKK